MNKRIQELAKQATGKQTPGASDMGDWKVIEKFAELIVQECVGLFNRPANQCTQFECMADDYATGAIKKHFGIK